MQGIQSILSSLQQQTDPITGEGSPNRNRASAVANALTHSVHGAPRGLPLVSGGRAATVSSSSSCSSGGTANGAGSTITANDFLTLLGSELKNQDPTAPTDPNAYIDQLVQVNSLQQLISINQGIGSLGGSGTGTGTGTGTTGGTTPVGG